MNENIVTFYLFQQLNLNILICFNLTQVGNHASPNCLRFDPRVDREHQQNCTNYRMMDIKNISLVQMYPAEFSSSQDGIYDAMVMTNAVPMLKRFYEGMTILCDKQFKSYPRLWN